MGNTLITPDMIAKEAAFQVDNNLVVAQKVNKQFVSEFASSPKVGDTIRYRKPVRVLSYDGETLQDQDISEPYDTIVINYRKHVPMSFSSNELTLTIEEFSKRYVTPAMIRLSNDIDQSIFDAYKSVYFKAGTAGTTPSAFTNLSAVANILDDAAVPEDMRYMFVNPTAKWTLANGLTGVYVQKIATDAIEKGKVGSYAGFELFGAQNVKRHTAGVPGGTPLVNGSNQTGSTINIDGATATTGYYNEGDCITFANVFSVNPITKQTTGRLQDFVVTATTYMDGSGTAALPISPAIITTGAYQNVTNAPADNAAITLTASHVANLAFHPTAITIVSVPLELPDGAAFAKREAYNGISVRVIKDYNISSDKTVCRFDVMWGVKVTYPELAARMLG